MLILTVIGAIIGGLIGTITGIIVGGLVGLASSGICARWICAKVP